MELLADHETLRLWLVEYGALALFGLLALEIIALPIPGEPLMVLTGVLIFEGDLALAPTVMAAYLGSIAGISVSYILGRTAGSYLVLAYGPKIGLSNRRMDRVNSWFSRFGKWTLVLGYFIPGLRHFTGLTAGMTGLDTRQFFLYGYGGAIVWVTIFISMGYFLGDVWISFFDKICEMF